MAIFAGQFPNAIIYLMKVRAMKKRTVSTRKIIVAVVLASVVGVCLLVWLFVEPDDGLVPILATVRVSQEVIAPLTAVKVDRKTEINEKVLGTDVHGTCHTTGTVHIVLTPNPTKAEFELFLIGESVSDTIGTHGPAKIASRAVTKYKAVKFIIFDGDSFTTTPAKVTADTDLTIEDVSSTEPGLRGRVVKRVAERRVHKAYQESRHIAAQRVIDQVSQQFDAAVQEHLDKLNRELRLKRLLGGQIADHDNLPMRLRTTEECLHVSFLAEQGDPRRLPEFTLHPDSAVRVGLNLIALAKNPVKTMNTIRLLYKNRRSQDSDKGGPDGKRLLSADGKMLRTVKVGTQDGWIVIHIEEREKN